MSEIDYPLSEMRMVVIVMRGKDGKAAYYYPNKHIMHYSQVDTFVKATVKLHYAVGNVHHTPALMLNNLWSIHVHRFNIKTYSYWWCSEDQKSDDPNGARLNDPESVGERVWAHPDCLKRDHDAARYESYYEKLRGWYAPV
ncbi:hypothetical protein [Flavobacterium sp.]|uniref:hypothetical protein n=1 Tax=Flavobacterium sp. TaxID=239 RepID=UPI0032631D69